MPAVRPPVFGFRLWLIWNVVAVVLLYAKPWGAFGWDELAVFAAPLMLLHPTVRRVDLGGRTVGRLGRACLSGVCPGGRYCSRFRSQARRSEQLHIDGHCPLSDKCG